MKLLLAASAALTLMAGPALSATFANYRQIGTEDTVAFNLGTLSDRGQIVEFDFLNDAVDAYNAVMQFTATGAGAYGGTLSFLREGDFANLLTVEFSGALLTGIGTSAALQSADPPGSITFTSEFFDFTDSTMEDFALSFSGLNNEGVAAPFGSPTWTAGSTGTFASDLDVIPGGGVVPEPAAWALMILGFGGVGAMLRRGRTARIAAFG